MENSIRVELLQHLKDLINDGVLTDDNGDDWYRHDDWHYYAFNQGYYIIGYYDAEQWLKRHNISAFEAIAYCIEYQQNMLGEITLKPEDINAEKIVNLYVYILGEELLSELSAQSIEELLEIINDELGGL